MHQAAGLRGNNRGPGGVNNNNANKIQWAFYTVRCVIETLELVQKMSFFLLNMGPVRVAILAPTLYFTLLTTCTTMVKSCHILPLFHKKKVDMRFLRFHKKRLVSRWSFFMKYRMYDKWYSTR